MQAQPQTIVKTLELGDVEVIRVEEWNGLLEEPQNVLADISEVEFDKEKGWLSPNHWDRESNNILVGFHPFVIKSAGKTILLDTGAGNDKERPNLPPFDRMHTSFLERLAHAGVTPESVDMVICTHLHIDHVGWNTVREGSDWVPTFKNARYVFPQRDWVFFDPKNDSKYSRVGDWFQVNVFDDSVRPVEQEGLVDFVDGDESVVIDENLTLEPAPGHTPGHMVLKVSSGGEVALFSGDMLHSPVQIIHPEWNSAFCEEGEVARETRRKYLTWAADTGALLIPAHFAGPHAARLQRDGGDFRVASWLSLESPS